MDGTSMNEPLSNLSQLSEESWNKLLKYFGDNSLSLQERCSLLNEIMHDRDTLKEQSSND
jgi:hypothetical protein